MKHVRNLFYIFVFNNASIIMSICLSHGFATITVSSDLQCREMSASVKLLSWLLFYFKASWKFSFFEAQKKLLFPASKIIETDATGALTSKLSLNLLAEQLALREDARITVEEISQTLLTCNATSQEMRELLRTIDWRPELFEHPSRDI